jgi:hypothetical protein
VAVLTAHCALAFWVTKAWLQEPARDVLRGDAALEFAPPVAAEQLGWWGAPGNAAARTDAAQEAMRPSSGVQEELSLANLGGARYARGACMGGASSRETGMSLSREEGA